MRGGYFAPGGPLALVPEPWRAPLLEATNESARTGQAASRELPIEGGTLIVSARPIAGDGPSFVWAGSVVKPPSYLRLWQTAVGVLTLASALLVTTALLALIKVNQSARTLNASLLALAHDLSAPIPRPAIKELREVADGIAGLAKSLAESRQIEARLNQELAQRERLAALGRVAAGVAHEVRNPLASIKLRLDLALRAAQPLPESVEAAIHHTTQEISRLDRLVADLLVVAGREPGRRTQEQLGPLVRARVDALSPWSAEKQVTIKVAGDADAEVDKDSLTRAIDNLLRNAVEASPKEGVVEVAISSAAAGPATRAQIEIADRGPGVPNDRVSELFEPFFTTKAGGTGLGLAICRSIARAHGGDVTYVRRGEATCFQLSLGGGL
jgi:signal transduction histidine kinase